MDRQEVEEDDDSSSSSDEEDDLNENKMTQYKVNSNKKKQLFFKYATTYHSCQTLLKTINHL